MDQQDDDWNGLQCGECGSNQVQTTLTDDPFVYGAGANAVQISVMVPIRTCGKCGYRFLDDEAEDIRHEAVCRHLGVMPPAEFVALRERHHLSQAELASLIKVDEETIAAWERGARIQNATQDQLLYLLLSEQNLRKLRERPNGTGSAALPLEGNLSVT